MGNQANFTRHCASEGRRFFPYFVASLLAAISPMATLATPDDEVQWSEAPPGPYLGQQPPGREPSVFAPGIVSTEEGFELNSVFSPDGRELMFARRVGKALKIFSSRQGATGAWSAPEMVEFSRTNSKWDEVDMWFAADSQTLLYISNAPAPGFADGSVNIWRVSRRGQGWRTPQVLPGPVNTDGHEIYPLLLADGTLYFSSTRDGGLGGRDIYVTRTVAGGFAEVSNLGANVNSPANEGDIYVAPDESYLVVTSNREGGLGKSDLYISFREPGGGWSEVRNLGAPINSTATDYCPVVSPDGRYFFFSRAGDVYWLDASVLEEYR